MTNIVWVYGSSAVGKETFIRRLLSNPPQDLIDHLGWNGKKVVCIEKSLQYIGQFENDPITKKREQIIKEAKKFSTQSNLVILIKGQNIDFEFDLLNRLKAKTPEVSHEIIFLHADLEVLFERSKKKSWWSEEEEQAGTEGIKKWLVNNQLKSLLNLKGFDITALDSTTHNYKPTKFPPIIK